jgi:GNAT superfamily N-acetyltransferase
VDRTGDLKLRHAQPSDYERVMAVMDEWWDGRPVSTRMSRVFFAHISSTSFVIEADTELVGFLLGFLSQTRENEASIHFVGVHPDYRGMGFGRRLYERFFAAARMHERTWVRSITAPCNQGSLAFHRRMGFVVERGDGVIDGIPVRLHFAGEGGHRVVFCRRITPDAWPLAPPLRVEADSCRLVVSAPRPTIVASETRLLGEELTDCA